MNQNLLLAVSMTSTLASCCSVSSRQSWHYPIIEPKPVVEPHFGTMVTDDFRNLESLYDEDVKLWMNAQEEFYRTTIENIRNRDILKKELNEVLSFKKEWVAIPRTARKKLFIHRYNYDTGVEKLLLRENLNAPEIELYSTENTISYFEPSFNGEFLAVGEYRNGDEQAYILIIDVKKKCLLPDSVPRAMYGNPQWLADGSGFFYTQLKEIKTKEDIQSQYEDSKVKLHLLGSNPQDDRMIFSKQLNQDLKLRKIDFHFLYVYPNSNKVLMAVYHGSQNYATLYWASLDSVLAIPAKKISWNKITEEDDKIEGFALSHNDLILLNHKSPNGIVEKVNLLDSQKREIIFKSDTFLLKSMMQTETDVFVSGTNSIFHKLIKIDTESNTVTEVRLPYNASVGLKTGWKVYLACRGLFFSLESWKKPLSIFFYDSQKNELVETDITVDKKIPDLGDLVVKNVEVPSHDGVLVPLTIIHKKGISYDGQNPTVLYAYGSHGTSIDPIFESNKLLWYRKGGIFAVAHVRGGGEKGSDWHMRGYKSSKENSWKDVIACAEYLIENDYTSSQKLAAEAESAGGITVGRAVTEKPSIFKAAIISAGVTNVLRFEKTNNTVNISEFGTVADSTDFRNLYNMDVYHHIAKDVAYPSMLFTASMNDARVAPWQPAKTVAKLQQASIGESVILLHIDKQGHFDASTSILDKYSFLFWQLGHPDFQWKEN